MRKTAKRAAYVLLALLIMIAAVPRLAAFKADAASVVSTWQALADAAASGGSIVLGADISGTAQLTVSADLTVDLGGHTLTISDSGTGTTSCAVYVGGGTVSALLTLKGSGSANFKGRSGIRLYANGAFKISENADLTARANADAALYSGRGGAVTIDTNGTVNLYGSTFGVLMRNFTSAEASSSPFVVNKGVVNICANADTSTATEFNGVALCACDAPSDGAYQVQIRGGTVNATSSQKYAVAAGLHISKENGIRAGLSVTGGSLNANTAAINGVQPSSDVGIYANGPMTISGGAKVSTRGFKGAGIRSDSVSVENASLSANGTTSGLIAFGTAKFTNSLVSLTGDTEYALWAKSGITADSGSSLRFTGKKSRTNLPIKNADGTVLKCQVYSDVSAGDGSCVSVKNTAAGVSYSGASYADGDKALYLYGTSIQNNALELRTGSTLQFKDDYICCVPANTKPSQLCRHFRNTNPLVCEDTGGNALSESDFLATGCTVKSMDTDTAVADSAVVVVLGDINGDSVVSTFDYTNLISYVKGCISYPAAKKIASDVNRDGIISAADLALLSYAFKNGYTLGSEFTTAPVDLTECKGVSSPYTAVKSDVGISEIIKGSTGNAPPVHTETLITRPKNGSYKVVQGGCTDGTYYYMILYYNAAASNVLIYKYKLSTGALVKTSAALSLDHANDICYNPKLKKLIIVHCKDSAGSAASEKKISFVDPGTLKVTQTKSLSVPISSLSYSPAQDKYVAGKGGTYHIMDANFKVLKTCNSNFANDGSSGYIAQGNDCDDNYIYFIRSAGNVADNHLVVYDWNGKFVKYIKIPLAIEGEHVFHVDDALYIGVYVSGNGGKLYRVRISP